jgi:hypothetical protein
MHNKGIKHAEEKVFTLEIDGTALRYGLSRAFPNKKQG